MSQDSNFNQGPIPQSAWKGVLALAFAILGLTFFSASMWTDGILGTGLSYHGFFPATLIGSLLLGAYTSFLGYIDAKTGLTTHLLARFSFGVKSSWLPSLLLGDAQVGWFGVDMAMFSTPVGKATGLDTNLLTAVSGLLMTVTVFSGISAPTVLSVIAVLAITYLGGYSVRLAVNGMGGLGILKTVIPARPLDFNVALALVTGSFISAGTLTANFIRFGRSAKLAVLVAVVTFFLGNSLIFIFGVANAAALRMADISDVVIAQGLLLPVIVVPGLNIWTANNSALYASGLDFASITGMSSKALSVINGIIGAICTLWLYNSLVGWLTFLSAATPSVGGIIITDYLMNRRRYEHFVTTHTMSVNQVVILAVVPGVAIGYWLSGIVPVNAVLGGALSYLILNPALNRKTTAAITHVGANSAE